MMSGTPKNSDAGSQVSDPARSRLAAWASWRSDSPTQVYQAARTSPLGQTQTALKWLWLLKIGPQAG